MSSGYIYVLSNPSIPGQVKIGLTTRSPEKRLMELSRATGVPTPFKLEHSEFVSDCEQAEKSLHLLLEARGLRVSKKREFFKLEVGEAKRLVGDFGAAARGEDPGALADALVSLRDEAIAYMLGTTRVLKNEKKAAEIFEKLALLGDCPAAMSGAWTNIAINRRQKALELFILAADRGYAPGFIGAAYVQLLNKNGELSFELIRQYAQSGSVSSTTETDMTNERTAFFNYVVHVRALALALPEDVRRILFIKHRAIVESMRAAGCSYADIQWVRAAFPPPEHFDIKKSLTFLGAGVLLVAAGWSLSLGVAGALFLGFPGLLLLVGGARGLYPRSRVLTWAAE